MKKLFLIAGILAYISMIQCGKKPDVGFGVIITPEEAGIHVTLPETNWDKTLVLLPTDQRHSMLVHRDDA